MASRYTRKVPALALASALMLTACGSNDEAESADDTGGDGEAAAETEGDAPSGLLEGELVTIELGVSPGGGYDQYARLLAPYLAEELDADVVVENVTGAGGLLSLNRVANAGPDGTTITLINGAGVLGSVLAEAEGIEFDIGEFDWIGRIAGEPRLLTINSDLPYEDAEDLIGLDEPFSFAATGPGSGAGIAAQLAIEAFEMSDAELVFGFDGSEESTLSVTAGEVDATTNTAGTALSNVEAGDHRPMVVIGTDPIDELDDVPPITDLDLSEEGTQIANALAAITEAGRLLAAPPNTDPDVLAELRAAVASIVEKDDFLADAETQGLEIQWRDASEVEVIVEDALDAPDVVRQTLADNPDEE